MKFCLSLFSLLALFFSCNGEDDPIDPLNCDQATFVNDVMYNNAAKDLVAIINAIIEDDCLQVTFSSSGCDGSRWTYDLYASEAIAESLPVQRYIRLSLTNDEECDAVIQMTATFDLSSLQTEPYEEMILNLDGFTEQILYTY